MEVGEGRPIERRIVGINEFSALEPAWRTLAARVARSPFESPAWLIPWLHHYGAGLRPAIVTWWRANELVGVAPLVWRRRRVYGIPVCELEFWGRTGTPLRGWVDIVADDAVAATVAADFAAWLAGADADWDLFHYLHLSPASPTLAALGARPERWLRVDLKRVLHSLEYELVLPADALAWQGRLGPKARREIRREIHLFERRSGGRVASVADPGAAATIVTSLRSLLTEVWGDRDAYFRRDPAFGPFLVEALRSLFEAGLGWVLIARDQQRVAACLVTLVLRQGAVATLIGVSRRPEYRQMSLGKCLFHDAIDGAVARGCRRFSFLTEDGYKRSFWRAEGQPIESGFLARGISGFAVGAMVATRRVVPARIRDFAGGGQGGDHRP